MVTIRVDYAGVSVMAQDLARASGQPYERVLRLETASMIKICALNAKPASIAKIKAAMLARATGRFQESGGSAVVVVNTRSDVGRTWFAYFESSGVDAARSRGAKTGSGRAGIRNVGAYMVFNAGPSTGHHLPDHVWHDYLTVIGYREESIKRSYKSRLRSRGLQLLSWLQVGDQLGIPLSSVSPSGNLQEALARSARSRTGRTYLNGTATTRLTLAGLSITVRNASPLAIKRQGQRQLDRAVAQRLRGFEIAMRKGVLDDLKLRAARWKGIFVN